jgi:hypothetical protein
VKALPFYTIAFLPICVWRAWPISHKAHQPCAILLGKLPAWHSLQLRSRPVIVHPHEGVQRPLSHPWGATATQEVQEPRANLLLIPGIPSQSVDGGAVGRMIVLAIIIGRFRAGIGEHDSPVHWRGQPTNDIEGSGRVSGCIELGDPLCPRKEPHIEIVCG